METWNKPVLIRKILISKEKDIEKKEPGYLSVGPYSMVYGSLHQGMMRGEYRGVQCTSMSLAASIFYILFQQKDRFRPKYIDIIIREGHLLHTFLRDSLRLSDLPDGKISIEDLPLKLTTVYTFHHEVCIQLAEPSTYVLTSNTGMGDHFLSVKTYIEARMFAGRCGFLLTVGDYCYAVLVSEGGNINLFDSHGHLHCCGHNIVNRAGVISFERLEQLETFIVGMYGENVPALIGMVSVGLPDLYSSGDVSPNLVHRTEAWPCEALDRPATGDSQVSHTPISRIVSPSDTESPRIILCDDEDMNPYVRMCGGGD